MASTKEEIRNWLNTGLQQGNSHVLIVCDTFDYSDYPVYIPHGTNPRDFKVGEMQRVMECYSMDLPFEDQLKEGRSSNWQMFPKTLEVVDELEQLREESKANQLAKSYETLEDDIMRLRTDIRAQAQLLKEMDLPVIRRFLDRVTELEKLQCKYDEWEPDCE